MFFNLLSLEHKSTHKRKTSYAGSEYTTTHFCAENFLLKCYLFM